MILHFSWGIAPQNPAMNGEHHSEGCPSCLLAGLTWPGLQMVGLQMEQMGGCKLGVADGGMLGEDAHGADGRCRWRAADGGALMGWMEGCRWGRTLMGQVEGWR